MPRSGEAAERYVRELTRMQTALRYPFLCDAIEGQPLCRLEGYGDGLTTVSVRESQLPAPYLSAVLGFRLVQFLQAGLMDPDLIYRHRMVHEPVIPSSGQETIHTMTITGSGQIVGYIGLVGSADPRPLALDSPARARFPVEVAHHVDLLAPYAAPGRSSHNAYEIKRFVREQSMPKGAQRDRVPWHLILAIGKVGQRLGQIRLVIGDSSERGALRHLRLVGLNALVIEGTSPWLPRTEPMWPSYELSPDELAKPFVAPLPEDLAAGMEIIESGLASADARSQGRAIARLMELHRSRGTAEGLGA